MAKLPAAPWTRRDDLAQLVAVLGRGNLRWVGGAIRDTLMGQSVADIDAATPLHPQQVMEKLGAGGIRTVPTGIDHGTITALLPGGNVEITTLRRDVSTDGRRATVEFANDWREDAARRDFTINALFADPASLELFDYFGGMDDLAAGRVRFIGDARQRIREDHLRILRYYRFQGRFGAALDTEAEEACAELAPMLKGLSRERVAMELLNLLALPDPADPIARMAARGVLQVILPEVTSESLAALPRLIAAEQAQNVPPSPLRRLAALLPPDVTAAQQLASRLRLSVAQKKRLMAAANRAEVQPSPQILAYRLGIEQALDRLLLEGADIAPLAGWERPIFPLKGGEIVKLGVAAGPQVALLLQTVESRWLTENFPPRERVLAMLDEEMEKLSE